MNIKELEKLSLFTNENLESLEKLPIQGFCNINYKLTTNKANYLIRVFKYNSSVNISRDFEFFIQKKASQINIASKPLYMNKSFMITEFLKGTHKETLKRSELKNLLKTIKKLHKIKVNQRPYKIEKDLSNYKKILKDKESKTTILETKKLLKKIKRYDNYLVTTHHDLNPKNIIFYNSKIRFIDWEYAGVNSVFFDLATVCVEFDIEKKLLKYVLKSYFKKVKKEYKFLLTNYIKIYTNICKLWFKSLQ